MKQFFLALALAFAGPAFAEEPAHEAPHGEETHNDDGHEAEGHGDDGHGEGHAAEHGEDHGGGHHGTDYTGDLDGDGTPNWRDSDSDGDGISAWSEDADDVDYKQFMGLRLILHFINLMILLGGLTYYLRRPVGDALANRAYEIRKGLTDSAQKRDEAKQRFDELAARLSNFEAELEQMKAEAKTEAKAEEAKLIERANREAERIKSAADRTIRDEVQRARIVLRNDAVQLAVQLAEQTLRNKVGADDQKKLARQFLESLNG